MKVAFIVPSLQNLGPTIVVNTIIKHLCYNGVEMSVYYFDESEAMDFNCPVYKIVNNSPIDFDSFDIIHSNMYRPDKYVYHWKHRIRKAKIVTTIHQDIFRNLRYNYNCIISVCFTPLWIKYIKKFDRKIFISNTIKNLYSFENSLVIHNGIDIEYNPQLANQLYVEKIWKLKQHGYTLLGTYAAINRGKGIDQLIELARMRKDLGIVIIGNGKEKHALQLLARRYNVNEQILFLPYLHSPYNYLQHIDIYVMPSRNEGFGLAMIEAAMVGVPVICSNIPIFHEIFIENQVVFFDLENIDSLSEAVNIILSKYKYYKDSIYSYVMNHFTGEIMAKKYLNLYNSIVD